MTALRLVDNAQEYNALITVIQCDMIMIDKEKIANEQISEIYLIKYTLPLDIYDKTLNSYISKNSLNLTSSSQLSLEENKDVV